MVGSIALTFFFIYLYTMFDEKLWYLKLLFLGFGMITALNMIDTMRLILIQDVPAASALIRRVESLYKIIIWAVRITFVALFIQTILNSINYFKNLKLEILNEKKGKEEDEK